jgi:hypothetical protein
MKTLLLAHKSAVIPSGARDPAMAASSSNNPARGLRNCVRICEVPRRLRDSG